jgi:hypothetical protein
VESGRAMEITGVYTIYFSIDIRHMEAPFIVTREATSNIIGMNVIRTYKLKRDVLTTTVTALLENLSLQTSEEYYVKVHTDIKMGSRNEPLDKAVLSRQEKWEKTDGRH